MTIHAEPDWTPRTLNPKPHTSFTQLNMYMRCSMQYYLRYVKGWKEPPKLHLLRGSAGHKALEWNYRAKIRTGQDRPLNDFLDKFSDLFDAVTVEAETTPRELGLSKDEAINTLTIFHHREAPKIRPVLVEWQFDLDIPSTEDFPDPMRTVTGFIDLVKTNGIEDSKFTTKMKRQDEIDLSTQLDLYDYALQTTVNHAPKSLGMRVFTPPGKTVEARAELVERSPAFMRPDVRKKRHDRLLHKIRTTEKAIQSGIFIPTDDPRTCGWCGFREQCQFNLAKDDFAATQET